MYDSQNKTFLVIASLLITSICEFSNFHQLYKKVQMFSVHIQSYKLSVLDIGILSSNHFTR